ncbi:acyltransferase family protein [Pararcticibacter amylolyticus]|uniref:DUF5009 domain-containing protein n=1 Tax=Pararcticibacter amylolyticus TaxID=2173175 RepID=A0A2U2PEK4_9SPHI|nr:DUF5009 domain-containing protein [Pararcticibacter amylolyticus]PWG79790.1 DUF5009 domain-containing protein [Pararcticibacter amylolyticus]
MVLQSGEEKTMRVLSIDVMRGIIMLLLAGESCLLYFSLSELRLPGFLHELMQQFFHHPWHGLRFWDLVQPAFMLIAGTAMFYSLKSKKMRGVSWGRNFKHILIRSLKLFLFGTALHCVYAGKMVWELWNVLTQLSITTIIAYLIIERSVQFQLAISVILLILTEVLYRTVLMPGFEHPFEEFHNFGAWFDTILMGKINPDGWVTINFVPTAAHTIWGVVAGRVLTASSSSGKKVLKLVTFGVILLLCGFALDLSQVTPIIKRISTSSFVLASGGWVLLILAFVYWLTDVKGLSRCSWIFVSIGMNAIFIYLFFETVGHEWLLPVVGIFTRGVAELLSLSAPVTAVFTSLLTLAIEWYICYWLYSKKVFIKL